MPALFRRHPVPVPTTAGWGLLFLFMAGLAIWVRLGLHSFLAVDARVVQPGARDSARVLVVEGWLEAQELDEALALYASGGYGRLVTTGGPVLSWREGRKGQSYADRAAEYLIENGPKDLTPLVVGAPDTRADRTYVSALALRDWVQRNPPTFTQVDVVSSGVHARRTRQMFRLALPGVAVGVHAAEPTTYDHRQWWVYSDGVKKVLMESLSVAWATCCFWPTASSVNGASAEAGASAAATAASATR